MITTLRHDQLDMPTQIFGDVLTNCLEDVWHQKLLQSHENLWDCFFSNYWELMDCLSEELFLSMSKFSWLSMIKFMNLRRPKTIQVCVDKRSTFMLFSIYQFNSYHGYLHLTNFDLSIFCLPLLNSHTHVWPCVPIVQANVPSFGCIITYNL